MKNKDLIKKLQELPPNADVTIGVLDDEWNDEGGIFDLEVDDVLVLDDGVIQLSTYVDIEDTTEDD